MMMMMMMMVGLTLTGVLLSDDLQQLVCRTLPDRQQRRWSSSFCFHLQQLQAALSSHSQQPGLGGLGGLGSLGSLGSLGGLGSLLPTETANSNISKPSSSIQMDVWRNKTSKLYPGRRQNNQSAVMKKLRN